MTGSPFVLPAVTEVFRARLEQDLLDVEAARRLQESVALDRGRLDATAAGQRKGRALAALAEAGAVLDGTAARPEAEPQGRSAPIEAALYEALVIHPRETQQRQHQLASVLGRVLHLLQGHEIAHTIARVTEQATPQTFPRLCRETAACARGLVVSMPPVHVARGEERLFTVMLDRAPLLIIHRDFVDEETASPPPAPRRLTPAELRFGVGHQLEHVRGGHVAVLQIGPEALENLLLDQVPFLVRTPIKMASKAIGRTGARAAFQKVGDWLPQNSPSQRVLQTVGDLLPGKGQETLLPEVVHDWVRSWIQGVEYSADRAGLLLSGSIGAACAAVQRLAPAPSRGAGLALRELLQENADTHRATADRLRELLRFALSLEYLSFVADTGQG